MVEVSTLLLLILLAVSGEAFVRSPLLPGRPRVATHDVRPPTFLGTKKKQKKKKQQTGKSRRLNGADGFGKSSQEKNTDTITPSSHATFEQISSDPLIFVMDKFLDAATCKESCREENRSTTKIHEDFYRRVPLLFDGQHSGNDGLRYNSASSADGNNDVGAKVSYPDGLHVDTNNGEIFRHVTCILYLNDIPLEAGGATVFPLAKALPDDPALIASRRMLEEDIEHTRSCGVVRSSGARREDDALLIESMIGLDTSIRIQPKAGRLLVFFSRRQDGHIDPRSWHGGERIRSTAVPGGTDRPTEKHILTLFKQVDYGTVPPMEETTFEGYLAPQIQQQSLSLSALCASKLIHD